MGKDGFIIYRSFYGPISSLTDEQLGRLFRCIFQWQIEGKANPSDDIKMAFGFFVNQFQIDMEKYKLKCDKNRNNAIERWDKARAQDANAYERIRTDANNADNDKDKEKEKDNENVVGVEQSTPPTKNDSIPFVPPTVEEVSDYCRSRGDDAGEVAVFFTHYDNEDWRLKNGRRMKSWRKAWAEWIARSNQFKVKRANGSRGTNATRDRIVIPQADDSDFQNTIF